MNTTEKTYNIQIDNHHFEFKAGETILDVCSQNGIKVPTLCHMKGSLPTGACRMCVVEDKNTGRLVPSCSVPATDGMVIETNNSRVIESRKTIVELLLANHPDDCLYCVRNQQCELQDLSNELQVRERRIRGPKNKYFLDHSSPSLIRDPEKCILCGRCVQVCENVMGVSAIDFVNRGSKTMVGTAFKQGLNTSSCVNCGQCIMVCPTGALTEKNHFNEIIDALNDPEKTVVVQYAPSITITLAEEFGMEAGTDVNGIMNAALRKIGFDYVFDTSFSADLTIMEESAELIHRLQNGGKTPMITSCCPGWIKYAEQFAPDFLENISSCKSPQQMMGAVIKSHFAKQSQIDPESIYSVSIMPCTAKKFEAQREEMAKNGISDVDAVLTTREFAKFIKMYGIDMLHLSPESADSPLGARTTAGKIFGTSGGVMEAAIRTAYYKITGSELTRFQVPAVRGLQGRKETKVQAGNLELGVAVVNGLANAKILLDEIRNGRDDIHFIEIMACPGGCIGGGGQPLSNTENLVPRMKALYQIDRQESIKVSHKNPDVKELYKEFLDEPLSEKSHSLLHVHYHNREVLI